ncbi:uncharacterized protein LOC131667182 [Phymastichus coffea]|uniref:uncharacterized protein LOC131667182 n=1 Tax=Phymastichus coffea TaxID=108790 RepID=UPI00273B78D3|nr:uncharacterized protein LOC131667182 [Phymastichus coffea]
MSAASLAVLSLCALGGAAVECRQLPLVTGFEKSINVSGRSAVAAYPAVTENESLVYAVCDRTASLYTRKSCDVSVETPVFVNASFKDTCPVRFAADDARHNVLSRLVVYSFGDDKVLFFWRQDDHRDNSSRTKLRLLKMPLCETVDLPIAASGVAFVVIYRASLELGLLDEKYCHSRSCKITLNDDGRLIDGPTKILMDVEFEFIYSLAPVSHLSPNEGFYVSVVPGAKESRLEPRRRHRLFKVYWDGVATELTDMSVEKYSSFSNAYGYFTSCESSGNTTINCRQYDASMNLKTNATVSFLDYGLNRWMQPHNLQDGSLLLVTGAESSFNSGRYKKFQLIMLYVTKQRPLVVEGLNVKCKPIGCLRVYVLENDIDEICFYFVCDRGDHRRSELKYSVKCLPKTYLNVLERRPAVAS